MSDSAAGIPVTLGAREYRLVPQKIGRISRRISAVFTLADLDGDAGETVTERLYDALEVFIPDLAPRWELAGYASEEDYTFVTTRGEREAAARDAYALSCDGPAESWGELTPEQQADFEPEPFVDPYDEARDRSPTPNEVADTVEAIFQVHGGQRLVRLLGNVIRPEAIRAIATRTALQWASQRSLESLSQNGGQPTSTPSSTSPETPAPLTAVNAQGDEFRVDTPQTAPSQPANAA